MSKINKNFVIFSLVFIAFLALGALAFSNSAEARVKNWDTDENYNDDYYAQMYYSDPDLPDSDPYDSGAEVRTSYVPVYVNKPVYVYRDRGTVLGASTTNTYEETHQEFEDLTANTVYGEGGFYPSGIIQWLGLAIIVLVIVILARKLFGGENRFHATPLKHS